MVEDATEILVLPLHAILAADGIFIVGTPKTTVMSGLFPLFGGGTLNEGFAVFDIAPQAAQFAGFVPAK